MEAQWVAKAFQDAGVKAGVFTGATATEAGVRYWAPGRKVLHLACHGLVDQEFGNFFGALALAPGPKGDADPSDDGILTLREIYELDLKGCELAILSACQTNYGPQQKGEGTLALSRGFLVAGVRRVVASNWLVDDEAAASLVSVYCTLLAKAQKQGARARGQTEFQVNLKLGLTPQPRAPSAARPLSRACSVCQRAAAPGTP